MFGGTNQDLGAELFKTWSEEQRQDEIKKLVEGYRAGVPVGILCKMAETIAGSKKKAKKYLQQFLSESERQDAVAAAPPNMLPIVTSFLG